MPISNDGTQRLAWGARFAFVLAAGLGAVSPAAAQQDQDREQARPAGGVAVRVDDGLLTLRSEGAPLADVLRAIGDAASFEVVLRGAFATPVHQSFDGLAIDEALGRLVGEEHLLVMMRGRSDAAADGRALSGIRVVERNATASPDKPVAAREVQAPVLEEPIASPRRVSEPPWHPILGLREEVTREDILRGLDDPDPAMRMAALPLARSLRPHEAVQVLGRALAQEDDMLVRSRGVAALTRLQVPGAAALLRQRALRDDDAHLRMQALNALAASAARLDAADRRAAHVLGQALRHDPEPQVRLTAIRGLGRVGGARARVYLQHATLDLDPDVATAAAEALASWPGGAE